MSYNEEDVQKIRAQRLREQLARLKSGKTETEVALTRFWGVGEEKFGTMDTGGFNGQISTNLYQRIQTTSGKII